MTYLSTGVRTRRPGELDRDGGESACRFVERLVSAALGVDLAELRSTRRGRAPVAFARHLAMYLAHVSLGLSLSRVGEHFGRDRTTVAYACARVEDRRDDPDAERVFLCLEAAVVRWRRKALAEESRG